VYEHLRGVGSGGGSTQPNTTTTTASNNTDRPIQNVREEERRWTWERWREQLQQEDAARPHRAVQAVLPNWEAWRDRRGVPLTYRMTQVLTGHEVFGEYLHRIQREVTAICHHCEEETDTAQHTLEFCPAWAEPRRVLRLAIGERLAPEAVVEAVMRGPQELAAFRAFCEQVMLVKERAGWFAGEEEDCHDAAGPRHHHRRRRRPRRPASVEEEEVITPRSVWVPLGLARWPRNVALGGGWSLPSCPGRRRPGRFPQHQQRGDDDRKCRGSISLQVL
jgi:hypothetical protein